MATQKGIGIVAILALFSVGWINVMEKKGDKQNPIWAWPDQKNTPLLGESGPFGSSYIDPGEKLKTLGATSQSEFASEKPMSETIGSLSLFVIRDPKSFFEGMTAPDHYLNLDLMGDDWGALFYQVLNCPKATIEPFSLGEDPEQWRERYRLKFQQAVPNYPLLSRIWDLYNYASYSPEEIGQLREECLKIQTNTSNEKARAALANIIEACDEALKLGSGLLFVPD